MEGDWPDSTFGPERLSTRRLTLDAPEDAPICVALCLPDCRARESVSSGAHWPLLLQHGEECHRREHLNVPILYQGEQVRIPADDEGGTASNSAL